MDVEQILIKLAINKSESYNSKTVTKIIIVLSI